MYVKAEKKNLNAVKLATMLPTFSSHKLCKIVFIKLQILVNNTYIYMAIVCSLLLKVVKCMCMCKDNVHC